MQPSSEKQEQNSQDQLATISQAQRERLFHIDFKLYFLGSVNRTDLVSRFGIKEAAASRDLSLYKDLSPKNIEYDTKAKTYIQRDGFSPLFEYSGSQTLAALLHGFGDDFVGTQKPIVTCEAPTQLNYPNIQTLAFITRAIHNSQVLKIQYRSLSSGLSEREIVPFALIDNGLRWHVRGYDRARSRFADFVVNRIEAPQLLSEVIPEEQTKAADNQWNRIVELHIVPHPKLKHPETIEAEYVMNSGLLNLSVRAALAGYVLRKWNVDCSKEHALAGPEYHLWLKNTPTLYGVDNLSLAPGYKPDD
ncbi:WYL domain-containing protein [Aestuariirhabdus sp. Z084]|uniref:WYL domain-containing protein n=1 Tax=Aestuariirhabdus haliotis TaxID=2918751 RepID=UPI0020BF28CC|nr:WYL domain-containing protein [Aestuariirhabdus haliotis]MCL6416027.1 WYL domain-containing protein [Aestuariirhabdus haliotis]